jgi:CubicO group peptidase (beta-lactamase class C family)
VCAWLAEEVTGKSYAEIISEIFWQKIGAEADGLLLVSSAGAPGAHGAINTTLRDLGRYGMAYTPMWSVVAKQQVVPDSLIRRIQKEGRPAVYQNGKGQAVWDGYTCNNQSTHAANLVMFPTTSAISCRRRKTKLTRSFPWVH